VLAHSRKLAAEHRMGARESTGNSKRGGILELPNKKITKAGKERAVHTKTGTRSSKDTGT